jgi:hypothetical protein
MTSKVQFKIIENKDPEGLMELHFDNKVITARNSNNFSDYIDLNFFHFGNGEETDFDFFDFIKSIPINEIPNNVDFDIINIYNSKTEKPLEQIPYPFNTLTFLKKDGNFYTRIYSFTGYEGWNKKWAIDYYFSEFKKVITKYPNVRIRENENEDYNEGKLKLEILNKNCNTILDAFEQSLPIINSLINEIDTHLEGFDKIIHIIETWQKNKENKDEEFWQVLFTDYPEIISQSFSIPFIKFKEKAYLGGKSIENTKGNLVDYAFKNKFTQSLTLIEIKTPLSKLVGSKYRNSHSISSELSGAINQLLKYKNSIQKDFYSINYNSEDKFKVFNPKCILIIGSFETLKEDERETFELFRNEFKTVDIVTFDELFDKIYMLLKLL